MSPLWRKELDHGVLISQKWKKQNSGLSRGTIQGLSLNFEIWIRDAGWSQACDTTDTNWVYPEPVEGLRFAAWQNPRPPHKPMTNTYCRFSYFRIPSSSHYWSIGWEPSDNTTYNLQRFQIARWVRFPTWSSIPGSCPLRGASEDYGIVPLT